MPKLHVPLYHSLNKVEAMSRAKTLLSKLKAEHGDKISDLQEDWSTTGCYFSFSVMSFSVSGTITVDANEVVVDGTIPFLASPWKGKAEDMIRTVGKAALR